MFNTVTAAQSVSCAENNATAITMVNTITQAEKHLSQVLVNIQFGDTPYGTPSTVGGNSTHSMRLNGTRSLVFAETVITVFKSWNAGSSGSISKYPVELQTSDVNADWEGWILVHSGQASDASVTTLDAPQQQPAVDGADDDTKGVSNLSVIAWQQKRARGLVIVRNDIRHQQLKQDLVIMTSPLRLQSQQASDTDDTTKVVSSLIGNSSVRASVTARALSTFTTCTFDDGHMSGKVTFQVEQPSAWSPSLSGSVTVHMMTQADNTQSVADNIEVSTTGQAHSVGMNDIVSAKDLRCDCVAGIAPKTTSSFNK